ncbi:DUF4124 domain-containing protein [Rhodoferax lacus]|uniref:DUF4124 domain-containing protein n=2 Tax=Rhodoferax lacus TaxID=2184758 RepID=A0A3E1R6A3_9BURK|nr:DUF4124 domain-containing protein [Rhodoferax lacus]
MLAVAVCSAPFLAWAQGTVVGGIYTCVDAQGRKLTSDRPIPECLDREQKVLNPSGTVAQKIGPSLTAAERAQKEAKDKQEQEANNRTAEDRRRDKALLMRFPNRAAHDRERAEAVAQSVAAAKVAVARLSELGVQRKKLDDEMEFYRKDPTKAPQYLRRQVEENNLNMDAQKRLILDQEEETKRINTRFDAELVRLRQLWPPGTH